MLVDFLHSWLVEALQNLSEQFNLVNLNFFILLHELLQRQTSNLLELSQNFLLKKFIELQTLRDKAQGICLLGCFKHQLALQLIVFGVCKVRIAVEDVFVDAAVKQIWFLLHDADLRAQAFQIQVSDFLAIKKYLATLAVVKAEQ